MDNQEIKFISAVREAHSMQPQEWYVGQYVRTNLVVIDKLNSVKNRYEKTKIKEFRIVEQILSLNTNMAMIVQFIDEENRVIAEFQKKSLNLFYQYKKC